jgi:hypothetical protein
MAIGHVVFVVLLISYAIICVCGQTSSLTNSVGTGGSTCILVCCPLLFPHPAQTVSQRVIHFFPNHSSALSDEAELFVCMDLLMTRGPDYVPLPGNNDVGLLLQGEFMHLSNFSPYLEAHSKYSLPTF